MITITWSEMESTREPTGGDSISLETGTLILDIETAENYEISALMTEHAVESRAQISDHKVPQLDRLTVDVFVSERAASFDLGVEAAWSTVTLGNGDKAVAITVPSGTTRTADAFETLRRLCREDILVDVDGLRRPIEGWTITGVSAPRDAQNAGGLACTLTMQEVSTASAEEIDAPAPRVERARNSTDRGRQRGNGTTDTAVSSDPSNRDDSLQSIRDDYGWDPATGEVL